MKVLLFLVSHRRVSTPTGAVSKGGLIESVKLSDRRENIRKELPEKLASTGAFNTN